MWGPCLPCAPTSQRRRQVEEKKHIDKLAVSLYAEGKISEAELDRITLAKGRRVGRLPRKSPASEVFSSMALPNLESAPGPEEPKLDHLNDKCSDAAGFPMSERDPITLEPLEPPVFCFKFACREQQEGSPPNSGVVFYNVNSIVAYIIATGDTIEPTTRASLSDAHLAEIDELGSTIGLPSVKEHSRSLVALAAHAEKRLKRDMFEGLERCLGEVIAEMLDMIDSAAVDPLPLVSRFHEFDHYFNDLEKENPLLARACLQQYHELAVGPKNKRRADKTGLLRVLLSFLGDKILSATNAAQK